MGSARPGAVREGLALALVLLAHAGTFLLFGPSLREAFPLDDAYTHHVYAEGLRYGDGFAYLPGIPAAGSTSPLQAVLLTPIQLAPRDALVPLTHAFGIVGWLLLAFATRRLVRALQPPTTDPNAQRTFDRAVTAAGFFVALDPSLAAMAWSGMEVILAALLLVLALLAIARDRPKVAGVLLGLGILARPELTLVWLVASALAFRRDRRVALSIALPGVLAWTAWAAWNHHAAGTLLPTTFFAKHGPQSIVDRWGDLPRAALQTLGAWPMVATLPLVALGARRLFREADERERPRDDAVRLASLVLLGVLLLWPLGIAWAHDLRETWRLYWWRYAMPAHPLVLVLLVLALRERRVVLAAVALALVAGVWSTASHVGGSARNVRELNVAAARFLDEHAAPDDWIASNDAGAVRRLTGRPVVDLLGLNDVEVLVDRAAVLQRRRPGWYVVFPSWFPNLVASPRYEVVARFRTEPLAICGECDQSELVILRPRSR